MQIIKHVKKTEYISDVLLSDGQAEFWYSNLLVSDPRRKEADALLFANGWQFAQQTGAGGLAAGTSQNPTDG